MTRGERAAARFVRELVPGSVAAAVRQLHHPGFLRVLAACRAELGVPAARAEGPAQRLIRAFPAKQRATLTSLLGEILDEIYDERRVSDCAAFLAGVSVGKLLARSCAARKPRQ
jgi:hypothetical protein